MKIFSDLKELFLPRWCVACGKRMLPGERGVCTSCLTGLPRTCLQNTAGNAMEQMFWGLLPVERASSLFYYTKGSAVSHLLYAMKYHGRQRLCRQMGALLATELSASGFFAGIDCLIPVPLHKRRLRERGYNQSEELARGISGQTHIPVYTKSLVRTQNNLTQTHKSGYERRENINGLFRPTAEAGMLAGKHILLVDDVLTTGATLTACGEALSAVKDVRISIVTLAWAKLNGF